MRKILTAGIITMSLLLGGCSANTTTNVVDSESNDVKIINCQYLTKEECADVLGSIDDYYQSINQKSLEFFIQRKGATVEEYREYSKEQAMDITEEEKAYLDEQFSILEEKMEEAGIKLPENNAFSLGLTTMEEASGAGGYTHGTTVFLNKSIIDRGMEDKEKYSDRIREVLAHELFHCLTRNNPDFRKDMYKIINFTVTDANFDIPNEVYEQIVLNPDVSRHDSYAEFTINGEKKNCYLVFLSKDTFENPGDSFFNNMYTGLVDIETGTLYSFEEASDFYQVVGENTDYCEDPEECMADNFSFAMASGMERSYKTPEIIESIIAYLQK